MLKVEVLKGPELFQNLKNEWADLARSDPRATPFQTFEWHEAWYRHYGSGKEPLAACVREGTDLIALLPLVRTSPAWRTIRSMGVGPSDYLHPLSRSDAASLELLHSLEGGAEADLLDLHQIRETNPVALGPQEWRPQATCLVLDLPAEYEAYLATLSKSLRYDIRKLGKSLLTTRKGVFEHVKGERLQIGFDAFLDMHKARWRSKRLPGAFVGRALRFHREWVEIADRNGWLRLKLLRIDGRVVGAIYGMAFGQTTYYYQAGFDPEMNRYSPGNLLVADAIRESIQEGRTAFDFMRVDEPYKRRWKPQNCWQNRRLLVRRPTLAGKLGLKWNAVAASAEMMIRARLEGPGSKNDKR